MVMAPAPERFCVDSCDLDKEETVVLTVPRKKIFRDIIFMKC